MRFQGKLYKDGKCWLAEVPLLEAMTQGRTRKEAIEMISDWFLTMANHKGFSGDVHAVRRDAFEIGSSMPRILVGLLLRRQRQKSGLSLGQAARRVGVKSRNAYARYERGAASPTVEKLDKLLRAMAPGRDIVLNVEATMSLRG